MIWIISLQRVYIYIYIILTFIRAYSLITTVQLQSWYSKKKEIILFMIEMLNMEWCVFHNTILLIKMPSMKWVYSIIFYIMV